MPTLIRPQFVDTGKPEGSPNATPEAGSPAARERRLYFVLALIVSLNVLAVCGAATFVFLAAYF